jgi:hypothetical protein
MEASSMFKWPNSVAEVTVVNKSYDMPCQATVRVVPKLQLALQSPPFHCWQHIYSIKSWFNVCKNGLMDRLCKETATKDGIYFKDFIHLLQFGPFGIKCSCVLIKWRIQDVGLYGTNVTHISKENAVSKL